MTSSSLISVVMAVYNGEDSLPDTLESILSQQEVDLEFIVVNDGSTDSTAQILQEYAARDTRLKLFKQDNQGVTRSLIRGCSKARGEFIARQDAGDISLPGRLYKQLDCLLLSTETSMVSCGTRMVGPGGVILRTVQQSEHDAELGLQRLSPGEIQGPSHHGSVMFRKNIYQRVGGYHYQFAVAQDLDLWLRLGEHGTHVALQEVLYQASVVPGSISMAHRDLQMSTARFILEAAKKRRAGKSEDHILGRAAAFSERTVTIQNHENKAAGYYFLGCSLLPENPVAACDYFQEALKADPLHVKARLRLLLTRFTR